MAEQDGTAGSQPGTDGESAPAQAPTAQALTPEIEGIVRSIADGTASRWSREMRVQVEQQLKALPTIVADTVAKEVARLQRAPAARPPEGAPRSLYGAEWEETESASPVLQRMGQFIDDYEAHRSEERQERELATYRQAVLQRLVDAAAEVGLDFYADPVRAEWNQAVRNFGVSRADWEEAERLGNRIITRLGVEAAERRGRSAVQTASERVSEAEDQVRQVTQGARQQAGTERVGAGVPSSAPTPLLNTLEAEVRETAATGGKHVGLERMLKDVRRGRGEQVTRELRG